MVVNVKRDDMRKVARQAFDRFVKDVALGKSDILTIEEYMEILMKAQTDGRALAVLENSRSFGIDWVV